MIARLIHYQNPLSLPLPSLSTFSTDMCLLPGVDLNTLGSPVATPLAIIQWTSYKTLLQALLAIVDGWMAVWLSVAAFPHAIWPGQIWGMPPKII